METKVLLTTPLGPIAYNLELLLHVSVAAVIHSWQIKEQLEADTVTVIDASGDGRHVW
jgi:hypothetical protein